MHNSLHLARKYVPILTAYIISPPLIQSLRLYSTMLLCPRTGMMLCGHIVLIHGFFLYLCHFAADGAALVCCCLS